MGEGWGEGEYNAISTAYIPLPFVPSRQGRGNLTFYEFIKIDELVKSTHFADQGKTLLYN